MYYHIETEKDNLHNIENPYRELINTIINYEIINDIRKNINTFFVFSFSKHEEIDFETYCIAKSRLIELSKTEKIPIISNIIFEISEDPLEFLKSVEHIYKHEKFFKFIFNKAIEFGKNDVIKYLFEKYSDKIRFSDSYIYTDFIETIKLLETLHIDWNLDPYLINFFIGESSIRGSTDVLNFMLEKVKKEYGNNYKLNEVFKGFFSINRFGHIASNSIKSIDVLQILLDYDHTVFDEIKDWNLDCTIETAIFIRSRGLARKICLPSIIHSPDKIRAKEFIIECQHEIGVKDFIENFNSNDYFDTKMFFIELFCMFPTHVLDYHHYCNILNVAKISGCCSFYSDYFKFNFNGSYEEEDFLVEKLFDFCNYGISNIENGNYPQKDYEKMKKLRNKIK